MLSILCPITSRNCPPELEAQPIFQALLPSLPLACDGVPAKLIIGYDSDDALWSQQKSRDAVNGFPLEWIELHALGGNLTGIWNQLAKTDADYILPANDDLEFSTSIKPAFEVLRRRGNFGLVAFADSAFPQLPTFFVVHRTHLEIFRCLYPLPWRGAHQDSWISDTYRPWKASEIHDEIKCRNHIGVDSRFEYGGLDGYRDAVIRGRRTVNNWLGAHPVAERLCDDVLMHTPMIVGETCLSL